MTEVKQQKEKIYPMDKYFLSLCSKYYETRGSAFVYMPCVDYKYITTFITPKITYFQNKHKTNMATLKQINTILQNAENDFINYHYKLSPYRKKGLDRFEELNRNNVGYITKECAFKGLNEADKWAKEQYLKDSQFPEKFENSRTKVLMTLQRNESIVLNSKDFGAESTTISNCDNAETTFTTYEKI